MILSDGTPAARYPLTVRMKEGKILKCYYTTILV